MLTKLDFLQNEIAELQREYSSINIEIEVKGNIYFKYIKCGKPRCKCAIGMQHGPYPHVQWWEDGKIKTKYLNEKNYPKYKKEIEKREKKKEIYREIIKLKQEEVKLKNLFDLS